jgi:uncharacterized protein
VSRARISNRLTPMLTLVALLSAQPCRAVPPDGKPLPEPLGYVSDHAELLGTDWRARIRSVCQDLERKTGVEMVVVTVSRLIPYQTANRYASALYEMWGVGSAQGEHGVLMLASMEERQAAVAVGKSLMGALPPWVLEEIGHQYLDPAFRIGHYGEGLYRASVALAARLQDIQINAPTRPRMKWLGFWLTILTTVGAVAFLWWISRPDLRHPFRRLHRGEFWGSGQGGFGGNFGGFGGATGEGLR